MNELSQLITIVFEVVIVVLGIAACVWFSLTLAAILASLQSISGWLESIHEQNEKAVICLQNLSTSENRKHQPPVSPAAKPLEPKKPLGKLASDFAKAADEFDPSTVLENPSPSS